MAIAKNTRTGKIVSVPDHYIGHSVLGKNLILVTDEVEAAPKKENKKKYTGPVSWNKPETTIEEQPAPEINIENEEIEDVN